MATALKSPVRLIDIAQQAGVSQITVSKVLHNRGGKNTRVSTETAARIRKIAERLNYRPNMAARQLSGLRSFLIGGILDTAAIGYSQRLFIMERTAAERGYRFLVGYSHDEESRIIGHINDFLGRGVEGVICMSHTYPEFGRRILQALKAFRNCVLIQRPIEDAGLSYVAADYVEAGHLLTRHLLEKGRRRICLMQFGPEYQTVQDEMRGYKKALAEAGMAFDPSLIYAQSVYSGDWDNLKQSVRQVATLRPDAIIIPNDVMAMCVLHTLADLGIRVPEDMAVVSAYRLDFGQFYRPSITSVDTGTEKVGLEAIKMLMEDIQNPAAERPVRVKMVPPRLIVGESSGG